jgi:hypothetical protein
MAPFNVVTVAGKTPECFVIVQGRSRVSGQTAFSMNRSTEMSEAEVRNVLAGWEQTSAQIDDWIARARCIPETF